MIGAIKKKDAAVMRQVMNPMKMKETKRLFFSSSISRAPKRMENTTPLPIQSPNSMDVRNTISA